MYLEVDGVAQRGGQFQWPVDLGLLSLHVEHLEPLLHSRGGVLNGLQPLVRWKRPMCLLRAN